MCIQEEEAPAPSQQLADELQPVDGQEVNAAANSQNNLVNVADEVVAQTPPTSFDLESLESVPPPAGRRPRRPSAAARRRRLVIDRQALFLNAFPGYFRTLFHASATTMS